MTTISRTTPASVETLLCADERALLRQTWRAKHAERALSASTILLYALLRGARPRAGFTPISNPVKLANGQTAWGSYRAALDLLAYHPDRAQHLVPRLKALLPGAAEDRLLVLAQAIAAQACALHQAG